MLKKVVQQKKANFFIDLNDTKNYTCWVLKEKNKDPFPILHSQESKNIFSYGAVGIYLQKMGKSQQNNPNSNRKYYNIRFNNLISDIFPFERNPEINFMYYNSENENLFGNNYYENGYNVVLPFQRAHGRCLPQLRTLWRRLLPCRGS